MTSQVLLAGRFASDDPSSGARLRAFADALHGVTVSTTAPADLAGAVGFVAVEDSRSARAHAIKHCDVAVVGGGNAFDGAPGARTSTPVLGTAALVALARAHRRPIALVGVGAERIDGRTSQALARFIVRSADLLVLRDEPSAAELNRAGAIVPIRVAADPAWCGLRCSGPAVGRDGILVVLDDASASTSGLGELSSALTMIASTNVALQPWRPTDVPESTSLADTLPARVDVLSPVQSLDAAVRSCGSVDVVIGTGEHALMAAAAAGTPAVAIGRSASLAALARRLGHHLVDCPIGARQLADVLERARGSRQTLAAVRHEQALAEGSLALLRLLVDRGAVSELAAIDGLALTDGRSVR